MRGDGSFRLLLVTDGLLWASALAPPLLLLSWILARLLQSRSSLGWRFSPCLCVWVL